MVIQNKCKKKNYIGHSFCLIHFESPCIIKEFGNTTQLLYTVFHRTFYLLHSLLHLFLGLGYMIKFFPLRYLKKLFYSESKVEGNKSMFELSIFVLLKC